MFGCAKILPCPRRECRRARLPEDQRPSRREIDADQNIEIGRAQSAQNFDALDGVDVAVQIAHFQSDIAQIIGQIFSCAFRQRCNQHALLLFDALPAKLDRIVDLIL